ncbi:trehalase-domain-containing protein [Scenedesmus sp. NREL 46B-D3]|nr:trehalase-domain-containing protein [Scenedesmus sp. NREL 46B-D3]
MLLGLPPQHTPDMARANEPYHRPPARVMLTCPCHVYRSQVSKLTKAHERRPGSSICCSVAGSRAALRGGAASARSSVRSLAQMDSNAAAGDAAGKAAGHVAAGHAAAGNAAAANSAAGKAGENAAAGNAGGNAGGTAAAGDAAAGNAAATNAAAGKPSRNAAATNAAGGNASSGAAAAAAAYPGYPRSGGLLLPHSSNARGSGSGSGGGSVHAAALQAFVSQQLDPAGSDLQECVPPDWQQRPADFLPSLTAAAAAAAAAGGGGGGDAEAGRLLQFGRDVHGLWRLLCRQVSPGVPQNPERHSLLPLPNRTVVPGDRFRETYYWDSYWVIRGLLVSGMTDTAAGLVGNLMAMLAAVGHVPNGARVYYLNRSQPPLLSAMVREVHEAAPQRDPALLSRALPLLLREHDYWTSAPKAVRVATADGTVHNMSRYYADWSQPRPESYREDVETAAAATGSADPADPAAAALYRELASGAESGWDYSSRWFGDGKTLGTIRTTQIVPADLNAFLFQMERNIAWAANQTGDAATSEQFNRAAAKRRAAMQALLWNATTGMWHDGILSSANTSGSSSNTTAAAGQPYTLTQNPGVFASNFVPLWAGLAEGDEAQGARVVQALQASGLVGPAGIATSLNPTGQQWDYPNGWPPLQHMLVEGASMYGGAEGDAFAGKLARTWVTMNMRVFNSTGAMHEKYDVSTPSGLVGRGGEYAPQVGFGWSNGVALAFLAKYF